MMLSIRRRLPTILAGPALGTLLVAGCATVAKSEPPAQVATSCEPSASQPVAHKGVASGDELERKDVAWSSREHPNGGEKRLTMKGYTPIDWSTKPPTENVTSEIWSGTGSVPVARGAVAIVGETSKPPPFAARRASEALDRLAGSVTIRHEKRGAVITLANDELVDSGQWVLTTSGQYTVRGLAAGLREQYGRTIFIQVYTDSMGSAAVNDALSLRRAEAIRDYLSTQGVAAESMRAEGQGSKRPLASNGTADGRAQNRRIEIVIAPQEREVDGH